MHSNVIIQKVIIGILDSISNDVANKAGRLYGIDVAKLKVTQDFSEISGEDQRKLCDYLVKKFRKEE